MFFSTRFLFLFVAGLVLTSRPVTAQSGGPWAQAGGGGIGVCVGGNGYVYAASTPPLDATVRALNAQGQPVWTQTLTSSMNLVAIQAIAADAAGNVWVTGKFSGDLTADTYTLAGSTAYYGSGFLLKYSPQGTVLRAVVSVRGESIALNPAGEVYLTGARVLAKYDAQGNQQWLKSIGADAAVVALDAGGGVWQAGTFNGTASFGTVQLSRAGRNGYLARYDAQGNLQWARIVAATGRFGAANNSYNPNLKGLTTDGTSAYLAGTFTDTVSFAGTQLVATLNGQSQDGFIVRYDAQGNQQWVRHLAGGLGSGALTTDRGGNVCAVGTFSGNLLPAQATTPFTSLNGNIYVVSYSPQGNLRWARQDGRYSANGSGSGWGIATDAADNLYITGLFSSSITLGGTTLNVTPFTASGFVARLGTTALARREPAAHAAFTAYPNPSGRAAEIRLHWDAPAAPGSTLRLLNTLGQELRVVGLAPGSQDAAVATAGLAPGCYLVQLRTAAGLSACRLVVE